MLKCDIIFLKEQELDKFKKYEEMVRFLKIPLKETVPLILQKKSQKFWQTVDRVNKNPSKTFFKGAHNFYPFLLCMLR